ncbi:MAG: M24 family metallopeptidase, partial [Gemmatimonadales bacterium]
MDYEGRRANLLSLMERERIDVLIISHLPNVRYLTGFTGSAGIAAVGGDDLFLVTDFRYESQATLECGERARVEIVPADPVARLWELLSRRGAATVGFEGDRITAREAHRFTEFAVNIRIEDAGGLVERLRARKEPDEVERVKQAARLATEALGIAVDSVQVGSTEVAVAATLEGELRRRGSEWHPFETIVASGARSALPHARTSCKTIAAGDLLLFDFGAMVDGYCCDISRTFVVGREPDERQRNVYE